MKGNARKSTKWANAANMVNPLNSCSKYVTKSGEKVNFPMINLIIDFIQVDYFKQRILVHFIEFNVM